MSDNLIHALSGASAGTLAYALAYPLNTISTILQVQAKQGTTDRKVYSGSVDAILKIIKAEGWQGLYSGLTSGLTAIASTQGVYYYFYESLKKAFEASSKANPKHRDLFNVLVAALAGFLTVFVTNPLWVVNIRMTLEGKQTDPTKQTKKKPTTLSTLITMCKEEGVLSLWKGVIPSLILVSNPTIQYSLFEKFKTFVESKTNKKLSRSSIFWLGALAKLFATFITYPYIVIKARLQMKQDTTDERFVYHSTTDVLMKIAKYEGISGFYKGMSTRLTSSVVNAAFLFLFKEEITHVLFMIYKRLHK